MTGSDSALRAFLEGDLQTWQGLPENADAEWVRTSLTDVEERAGGLLRWRGGAAGPEGALVWLAGDRVELIELPDPDIPLETLEALGEAEFVAETPWSRTGLQHAWPSRGLAVHATFDGVIRVLAFAPMDVEEFAEHRFARTGRPPRRP